MPKITPEQARASRRRRTLLSWVPITLIAVGLIVIAVTAVSASGWWWFQNDARPSDDQSADDASTLFTGAGIDYLAVDGTLRVKIRDDAPTATELGLAADDQQRFEMRVPITAIVLAEQGALGIDLVKAFEVRSRGDRVTSVSLDYDTSGGYRNAFALLREQAPRWGWQIADVDALEIEFVERLGAGGAEPVVVALEPVPMHGAYASAAVTATGGGADVTFTVSSGPTG